MKSSYQNDEVAKEYENFLASTDGKIQQKILWQALEPYFKNTQGQWIADIGCGNGWLLKKISNYNSNIKGSDLSPALIELAKKENPNIEFKVSDVCNEQPFPNASFDIICMNMVAHDLENQPQAFKNVFNMVKPNSKFILTIINPYYAYPVGVWKRNLLDFLLFKKSKLILKPYNLTKKNFVWKTKIPGLFYPLPETLNTLVQAGFRLKSLEEITSPTDSSDFDLNYRLYRFPIILLLELEKTLQ